MNESNKVAKVILNSRCEPTFSVTKDFCINFLIEDNVVLNSRYFDNEHYVVRSESDFFYVIANVLKLTCKLALVNEYIDGNPVKVHIYECSTRNVPDNYFSDIIGLVADKVYSFGNKIYLDIRGLHTYKNVVLPNGFKILSIVIKPNDYYSNENCPIVEVVIPPTVEDVRFCYCGFIPSTCIECYRLKLYMPSSDKYFSIARKLHYSLGNSPSYTSGDDYSEVIEMNNYNIDIRFYG